MLLYVSTRMFIVSPKLLRLNVHYFLAQEETLSDPIRLQNQFQIIRASKKSPKCLFNNLLLGRSYTGRCRCAGIKINKKKKHCQSIMFEYPAVAHLPSELQQRMLNSFILFVSMSVLASTMSPGGGGARSLNPGSDLNTQHQKYI